MFNPWLVSTLCSITDCIWNDSKSQNPSMNWHFIQTHPVMANNPLRNCYCGQTSCMLCVLCDSHACCSKHHVPEVEELTFKMAHWTDHQTLVLTEMRNDQLVQARVLYKLVHHYMRAWCRSFLPVRNAPAPRCWTPAAEIKMCFKKFPNTFNGGWGRKISGRTAHATGRLAHGRAHVTWVLAHRRAHITGRPL